MRTRPFACLFTVVSLSLANLVHAQDPLDEMYGQAVHSFFRGDSMNAEALLNEVIEAGSQDPRAYYFRGLCKANIGMDMSIPDFEKAAQLEIDGKKVVNVGKALERIQGQARIAIEKSRSKARLVARAQLLEIQRTRYEEVQRGGGSVQGGIVVPPRMDPAPNPSVFAPNDPFNEGMTKGEAKVMPKVPGVVVPDEFAPVAPGVGEIPAEPAPTPEENDPFK